MANLLVHESSPYLLQHAHNPVNWRAWNDETLALAKSQKKLMLVSIGYSACHWCHVMEKHCFENQDAARLMNKYFICVKVDREERPDIDAVYMQALQLMSGQGGWPLNCFTLPDGRPIFGGTYFPLEKWMSVLENLQDLFHTNLAAMEEYAERLMKGIQQTQFYQEPVAENQNIDTLLYQSTQQWKKHFDVIDGGTQRVPKFPMPCNYAFLMAYAEAKNDNDIRTHVINTLDKMSMGGLFDQIEGGFARYSTDGIWKVPHFEKMLYDNAQLISLYSKAYSLNSDSNYKTVIEKTLNFITHNFTGKNGEFYAALDADSEGEEGKYYVWRKEELQNILLNDFDLFSRYYNINELGHWEHGNYILMRVKSDADFCIEHHLEDSLLQLNLKKWQQLLLAHRKERTPPGLDDKTLTSWNAMMIKGYTDAFLAIGNETYLSQALQNAHFILTQQVYKEKFLYHSYKNKVSTINGFLEDYAFTADSFISLYTATGDETWLKEAGILIDSAIEHFYDEKDGLFYFNSVNDAPLITRQKEVQDNVIPSSNAVMANVLFQLSIYFENERYLTMSKRMCAYFYDEIEHYGSAYACWALLLLKLNTPVWQIAMPETKFRETVLLLQKQNKLNIFPYGIKKESILPFIEDKKKSDSFYICIDRVCSLPLNNQNELITAIDKQQAVN